MATITLTEAILNQQLKVPFVSVNNQTGLVAFANTHFLLDGVTTAITPTYTEIGHGLYVMTFTPTTTGVYTIFIEQTIAAMIKVVAKSLYSFLLNLEDEAIGSWTWDKTTNLVTFIRQDSTTMATFTATDNLTLASRERLP